MICALKLGPFSAACLREPYVMNSNAIAAIFDPEHPSTSGKVPRNSPCPCGSGNKYKHCHGKAA